MNPSHYICAKCNQRKNWWYGAIIKSIKTRNKWVCYDCIPDIPLNRGIKKDHQLKLLMAMCLKPNDMEFLSKNEQAIMLCWHGLFGMDKRTLKEIGDCLEITPERCRQIATKAIRKLAKNKGWV